MGLNFDCFRFPVKSHFATFSYRGFKRVAGQKVPPDTIAYFNKNFIRDNHKLLRNMNGGKTKFIGAREKRMRAQIKRDRDQQRAISMAAQQQAIYATERQLDLGSPGFEMSGLGSPGFRPPGLGSPNLGPLRLGLAGQGPAANARLLCATNDLDFMRNQQLLASRPMALPDKMRVAEQVFAAEQAMAAQQQRGELQLQLLRGSLGGGFGGVMGRVPLQRDPVEAEALNQLLARNALHQSQFPAGSIAAGLHYQLSQFQRRSGNPQLRALHSAVDVGPEQHNFLARQMGNGSYNNIPAAMAQQITAQRMRVAGLGNIVNPDAAAAVKLLQQRMQDEQLLQMAGLSSREGDRVADQHLLQLYLMDQQRKTDVALNRNIRQG